MKEYTEHTQESLIKAYEIQKKLTKDLCEAHEKLSAIHSDLDNGELWKIRARVQDALRSMDDLQTLRKDLPMVDDI